MKGPHLRKSFSINPYVESTIEYDDQLDQFGGSVMHNYDEGVSEKASDIIAFELRNMIMKETMK